MLRMALITNKKTHYHYHLMMCSPDRTVPEPCVMAAALSTVPKRAFLSSHKDRDNHLRSEKGSAAWVRAQDPHRLSLSVQN